MLRRARARMSAPSIAARSTVACCSAIDRRISKLGVDVGDRGLPLGEQLVGVDAELIVVGGVDDSRRERAAQREVVSDEETPPRCDDRADRLGEGLGLGERLVDFGGDFADDDVDRFGHELCLAAREVAPERAARSAGVNDDLAQPDAVDAALAHERCGAAHHPRARW